MTLARHRRSVSAITFSLVLSLLAFEPMSSTQMSNKQHNPPTSHQKEPFKLISVGDASDRECKEDPLSTGLLGKAIPPECVLLGWRVYEAADGSRADLTYGKFDSPKIAIARLQFWMKPAKKIIQKENRKDAAGNAIGQRIVASFGSEEDKQDYFQVGWTNGRDAYLIRSGSLSTALSLEERVNMP